MNNRRLQIYVPLEGSYADRLISKGSGIVGDVDAEVVSDDCIMVYYEGNIYGAENLKTYEERVMHAAGRLIARYPTVAKAALPKNSLVPVGTYEYETRQLDITAPNIVKAWTGGGK